MNTLMNVNARHQALPQSRLEFDDIDEIRPQHMQKMIEEIRKKGISRDQIGRDPQFENLTSQLLDSFMARSGSYSKNTISRFMAAWGLFERHCKSNDRVALPADENIAETYLMERGLSFHRNTVSVDAWAISLMHKICGCPNPIDDSYVKSRLKEIRKNKVLLDNECIKQAPPLRLKHLNLLDVLWRKSSLISERRNLALLHFAHETLLRSAELRRIKISDIEYCDMKDTYSVKISITKTNDNGENNSAFVSHFTVAVIKEYFELSHQTLESEGYLFRATTKHNTLYRRNFQLSEATVTKSFFNAWKALNPSVLENNITSLRGKGHLVFSAHSARVGAAQDLASDGFTLLQIMQAGRWSSEAMVSKYIRHLNAQESAMGLFSARRNR